MALKQNKYAAERRRTVARGEARGVGVTCPRRLITYIIEPVRRRLEEEYIEIRNICMEETI